ncbi:MAG: hypothetical protein ACPG49_02340 [Chitinophagales bacterium]
MNKFVAFFLILFATTFNSLFAQFEPDTYVAEGLQLGGVYVAPMNDDYITSGNLQQYVRFFQDGTVVTALSSDSPAKVMEWLFPGNNVPMGTGIFNYKEKSGKMKFTTTSAGGKIVYKGVLSTVGDLLLTMSSKITRNQFQKSFEFISETDAYNAVVVPDNTIDGASPHQYNSSNQVTTRPKARIKIRTRTGQ